MEYTAQQVTEFCKRLNGNTAVDITADHGGQLNETGTDRRFGRVTPDMSEDLLHVPLILVNPDLNIDQSAPISHLDLGKLVTVIATETEFKRGRQSPQMSLVLGWRIRRPITRTSATGTECLNVSISMDVPISTYRIPTAMRSIVYARVTTICLNNR